MVRMMLLLLFVCVSVGVHGAVRPSISDRFAAKITFEVVERGETDIGHGLWAADTLMGRSLEVFQFERSPHLDVFRLQRFDTGKAYGLSHANKTCDVDELEGEMPSFWQWVEDSEYMGLTEIKGKTVDMWLSSRGYATMELAVAPENPHVPLFIRKNSSSSDTLMMFTHFDVNVADNMFEPPTSCDNVEILPVADFDYNGTASCRKRSDMLKVANAWVKAKVKYNQHTKHTGYRMDCSGYVSACWALSKPGAVTQTLHNFAKKIAKKDLKEGDCLLKASAHVVLFAGWANKEKTLYHAYEEANSSTGTIKSTINYPYYHGDSAFLPYRMNHVCA